MAADQLGAILQHVREAALLPTSVMTDRQLLLSFRASGDELAFKALVHRFGRLVLSVCRQVLGHEHDAEDAFQATFLILARKADTIRKAESVASWLYGVAYRVAMRTKHNNQKRTASARLTDSATEQDPGVEAACRELQAALHDEVNRLPKTHRAAFVLCCFEGRSKKEAAEELGWKEGTVSGRLARARQRLRERLARRGFELSAVLGVIDLTTLTADAGAVPAAFVQQNVPGLLHYAAGRTAINAGITAKAVALAEGVMKGMIMNKTKLTLVFILVLSLLGTGVRGLGRRDAKAFESPAKSGNQGALPEKREAPPKLDDDDGILTVKGIVLRPTGAPAQGVKVTTWNGQRHAGSVTTVRATTGRDGTFRFTIRRSQIGYGGKIIATAQGVGPDWIDLRRTGKEQIVKLQLVKDDVPIQGRILDLEGKPIAGVSVEVHRLSKTADGKDVGAWIDRNVAARKSRIYLNEKELSALWSEALGERQRATTDKQGRFELKGLGRDRVVRVFIKHDSIEHARGWAVTRKGPKRGWITGSFPLYAAAFDHLAAPSKPLIGTVRDKATGKPISGIIVSGGPSASLRTTTDKDGRYRLLGVAKRPDGYYLSTGGAKGRPYFGYTKFDVRDTPGLAPITVDFDLERGIEITGTVINKATGKPVRGNVRYNYPSDNPNLKKFATIGQRGIRASDWGRIGPDGSFAVLGFPGPGVLIVLAEDETAFPILNTHKELAKLKVRSFPVDPVHAFVAINVSEDDPKTRHRDIVLIPGATIAASVVGPDGKALSGARVAGLSKHGPPTTLETDRLHVRGVKAGTHQLLILIHEKKKLGTALDVGGKTDKPIIAKMQPLGSLQGRLVDEKGKALAGRDVVAYVSLDRDKFVNVPLELFNNMGIYGLFPSAWKDFTGRKATTDKDGRFKIEGIISGLDYTLSVGRDVKSANAPLQSLPGGPRSVDPGKCKDLGDLKHAERPLR